MGLARPFKGGRGGGVTTLAMEDNFLVVSVNSKQKRLTGQKVGGVSNNSKRLLGYNTALVKGGEK